MPNYPREQLLDLYKSLPKELQVAIFSADNADKMLDICKRNGVNDDKIISEIAKNSGYVMMGVLPPSDLQKTIEKEAGLKKEIAEKVAWEISRFIFLPVRQFLEPLYNMNFGKSDSASGLIAKVEKPASKKKSSDSYRETVE